MSRLELLAATMVFTRSRIQWVASQNEPPTLYRDGSFRLTGTVKGCDILINIYGHSGYWHWTIRSRNKSCNLIIGVKSSKTLRQTMRYAAKFAIVQLLRQIDPKILNKRYYAHNTFCGFEPL